MENCANYENCSFQHGSYSIAIIHQIGFGKCGTTTLMRTLHNTSEVFMGFEKDEDLREIHLLRHHDAVDEFKEMYKNHTSSTSSTKKTIKGFKSPEILMSQSFMENIETHFPDIDFIVSTRHPVLHFQSLYNFKLRSKKFKGERPDPLSLIGDCIDSNESIYKKARGVCTMQSFFHYGLSRMMLTPMNTTHELNLIDSNEWSRHPDYRGNIFLIEIGQLGDKNITRKTQFTNDLEDFLGLTTDSLYWHPKSNKTKERFLDICEERNKPIRELLVEMGTKAANWIKHYLLESPRVLVANREHFIQLIEQWKFDPCSVR